PLDNNYSYRFSWGDGSISEWKEIASTTYSWRRPGTYLVQSQTMRIGIYNAWSDYITVIIRE
ncbi:MAG: PKD domain-containing protein, partial [Chitinispirillaceae bacterium]